MAHFGLDGEVLTDTVVDVQSLPHLRQDHHGRTPLDIIRRQRMQEEQKRPSSEFQQQLARCDVWFQQVELMKAKAKQDRVQMEYTVEDALLQTQLEGITITRHTPCIEGHLMQCVHELQQHLQDHPMHLTSSQLFQCAFQLRQAIMLHWEGPQYTDQQTLTKINASLPLAARLANSFLHMWPFQSPLPKHGQLLNVLCISLSNLLALPEVANLLESRLYAYKKVLAWCNSPSKQPTAGTWLHDVELGSVLLTQEAANKLMPEGKMVTEMEHGHHVVITHAGMHFKCLKGNH